jgi:signal transduction histidine kinase
MNETTLDHLMRVATEQGQPALWFEALPWITETSGAQAARLVVGLVSPVHRQHRLIEEPAMEAIDRWEESLFSLADWVPASGSLSSSPPVAPVTADLTLPLVHVTIRQGNAVIGGLSLVFERDRPPGDHVISLVYELAQTMARLAATTSDRHQLQRRLTQVNLLYEVSRAISSSLDTDMILHFTTALAANALGAEASSLLLVDSETQELVYAISHGTAADSLRGRRVPMEAGVVGWVARNGQATIVNDTANDSRYSSKTDADRGFVTRNILCAPLHVKDRTLGVLQVLNKEGNVDFDAEDTDWLMALAAQASVAIENAYLYTSLREERDRILKAEEELRHRLAGNLHDSAAQLIGSLIMNIEVARRVAISRPEALEGEFETLRDLAVQINQEIRQSLLELRPLMLESRGLVGALQVYLNQQKRYGFVVQFETGVLPEIRDKQAEAALYLIIQEALTNVRKHANASHTWLRLRLKESWLTAEVEDDGRGFAVDQLTERFLNHTHLGLLSMRERAGWLGGSVEIASPRPGHGDGTLLKAQIPLARLTAPPREDTAAWLVASRKTY